MHRSVGFMPADATFFLFLHSTLPMTGKIVIPMITPHRSGELDEQAIESLISYAKSNRFDGLFAASSTGGCAALSYSQHLSFMGKVLEKSSGLTVFANISRNNLEETLAMLRDAENLGFERFVLINPYYHRFSENSMSNYFSIVAEKVKGSLYLYNNPSLTGLTLSPGLVSSLAEQHSAVRGIKDSGGDLEKFGEFLSIGGIEVYQGKDHLLEESMKMGAFGGVCSTSNFSLNTLHVAHDEGAVSSYTERIVRITEVMKRHEVPAFHNYMFRHFVMGEDAPSGYMNAPFEDLPSPPSDSEVLDIV